MPPGDILPLRLGYDAAPPPLLSPAIYRAKGLAPSISGPSFVTSKPADLLPPRLGWDLALQPLMQPGSDRVIKAVPQTSGPTFLAAKPTDILPLRLGYDLTIQPLLPPAADRVIKGLPEVSGPIFVTSKPADLLPLRLGYELTTPPFLSSGNRPHDKGTIIVGSGPYFVTADPDDISRPVFGYDLSPQRLERSRPRPPIPDTLNLADVMSAVVAEFVWAPEPVGFVVRISGRASGALIGPAWPVTPPSDLQAPIVGYDLVPSTLTRGPAGRPVVGGGIVSGPYFVTAAPGDLRSPVFGYDLTPPAARSLRLPIIMAATGSTLVLSSPGDLLRLALGYELTSPALARARRRAPIPDMFNEPSVLVVITVPATYGYDAALRPLLSISRLRRTAALLGQPLLVPSQASDLRPSVLGYDLTPTIPFRQRRASVPSELNLPTPLVTAAAFVWSADQSLFLGRVVRRPLPDIGFVPPPPLVDVWGFALTPGAPLVVGRRGALIATGPSFVAASPGDIARLGLGYDLAPPPLLPVPAAPRRGGRFAIPVFVPLAPSDLRPADYGYDLTPGLYTLLRAISHNTGFFLQSQLLSPLVLRIGFIRLIGEFMAGPAITSDSLAVSDATEETLTAATAAQEDLE